jgi:hypothetical protein
VRQRRRVPDGSQKSLGRLRGDAPTAPGFARCSPPSPCSGALDGVGFLLTFAHWLPAAGVILWRPARGRGERRGSDELPPENERRSRDVRGRQHAK